MFSVSAYRIYLINFTGNWQLSHHSSSNHVLNSRFTTDAWIVFNNVNFQVLKCNIMQMVTMRILQYWIWSRKGRLIYASWLITNSEITKNYQYIKKKMNNLLLFYYLSIANNMLRCPLLCTEIIICYGIMENWETWYMLYSGAMCYWNPRQNTTHTFNVFCLEIRACLNPVVLKELSLLHSWSSISINLFCEFC